MKCLMVRRAFGNFWILTHDMTLWRERSQSHVFQFTVTSVQVCLMSNKVRDLCCSEWEACSCYWFCVWRICYGPYWCIFISLMCYLVSMTWVAYCHSAWILLVRYRGVSGSSSGRSTVYRESDFWWFFFFSPLSMWPNSSSLHHHLFHSIFIVQTCYMPHPFNCPWSDTQTTFEEYKLQSFSLFGFIHSPLANCFKVQTVPLPPFAHTSSVCDLPLDRKTKFLIHVKQVKL